MNELTELDKLEKYLREHNIPHERIAEPQILFGRDLGRYQIIVYDEGGERQWDAICHYGSYGYEQGLLEVMGQPVACTEDGTPLDVVGWLTAQDVIDRLEGREHAEG